jgi:hypothetical protein
MITYCPPITPPVVPHEDDCKSFPSIETFQRWLVEKGIEIKGCPADWRWP